MQKTHGTVLFKCNKTEHCISFSVRDTHLLDEKYFFENGWFYREFFGINFVKGLKTPPKGVVLKQLSRVCAIMQIKDMLTNLETQRDLIEYDYSYEFENEKGIEHSGGMSGFLVNGKHGFITTRPSGYCTITLSESAPNGRGRIVEIIDMRVKKQIATDDRGLLRIHRKKQQVGWFKELPKLLHFLEQAASKEVEVIHPKIKT